MKRKHDANTYTGKRSPESTPQFRPHDGYLPLGFEVEVCRLPPSPSSAAVGVLVGLLSAIYFLLVECGLGALLLDCSWNSAP